MMMFFWMSASIASTLSMALCTSGSQTMICNARTHPIGLAAVADASRAHVQDAHYAVACQEQTWHTCCYNC
jgi:hypothetical protein